MKIPETPPDIDKILETLAETDPKKITRLFLAGRTVDEKGRYLHWEQLKYKPVPEGMTSEEWWAATKLARSKQLQTLPGFYDKNQRPFKFFIPDSIQRDLHWVTQNASGYEVTGDLFDSELKNKYSIRAMMNESILSSQLEGAATTTPVAKDMLRLGRPPRDASERMIMNNYLAMQFIRSKRDEELTPVMLFELHRILTRETLKTHEQEGRLRQSDDIVVRDTLDQRILHVPPKAEELPERIKRLCHFANEEDAKIFINPVIKAIILHFMLAYDHPFADGNGRTARALFYWMCSKKRYELIEFLSISKKLKEEPGKYKAAYLYSETDANDLTYFLLHQMDVLKKELDALFEFLKKESEELRNAQQVLEGRMRLDKMLNPRQIALIKHALKHPGTFYTIYSHKNVHGVTYQTARTDITGLADRWGLLNKLKEGKTFIFESPLNLRDRIMNVKDYGVGRDG